MITAAIGREQSETPTSTQRHLCQRRHCQGDATSWEGPRIHRGIRHDLSQTSQTKNRSVAVRLERLTSIKVQFEALNRSQDENAELASKVFELSQTLRQRWLTADYDEKRKILEIVWLDGRLVDATLCPTTRKPFDIVSIRRSRGWLVTRALAIASECLAWSELENESDGEFFRMCLADAERIQLADPTGTPRHCRRNLSFTCTLADPQDGQRNDSRFASIWTIISPRSNRRRNPASQTPNPVRKSSIAVLLSRLFFLQCPPANACHVVYQSAPARPT